MTAPDLITALRSIVAPGSSHLDVKLTRADIVALLRYIDGPAAIARGDVSHLYEGDCPDRYQPDARDPHCPACVALGITGDTHD